MNNLIKFYNAISQHAPRTSNDGISKGDLTILFRNFIADKKDFNSKIFYSEDAYEIRKIFNNMMNKSLYHDVQYDYDILLSAMYYTVLAEKEAEEAKRWERKMWDVWVPIVWIRIYVAESPTRLLHIILGTAKISWQ